MTLVNTTRLKQLRVILSTNNNISYTDEQLASAALIVTRFVVCKERQLFINNMKENIHSDDTDEQKSM